MLELLHMVVALLLVWSGRELRVRAPCRFGEHAEFTLPPSALRFCLGESKDSTLSGIARSASLGPAIGFSDASVHFTVVHLPQSILSFDAASPTDSDVLVMIEGSVPMSDSGAAAQ